ncbi:hypothetical protein AMJ85_01710 [candidate division BRC1 bacterium SM23_51]|nr:MAG: hypothetical protein AMJ85_01710 [candidate division BRC1 bacterium SM23_51]
MDLACEIRQQAISRRRLVVYGLILVGGAMRLYALGEKALWVDEINSVQHAKTVEVLMDHCRTGHEPPLRYLLVWALQRAPNPDFAVRLPAAVLGTLSILLMLWVGERLWNWRAGVVAAVLLLLSPWHLNHSQDARYYAVMLFLALAAVGLAVRIVEQPRPLWRWVVLAIVCALDLYISYVALFAVAPVAGYLMWSGLWSWLGLREREQAKAFLRGAAVGAVVGFLCLAPWLPVMFGLFEKYTEPPPPPQVAADTASQPAESNTVQAGSAESLQPAPPPPARQRILGFQTRYDRELVNEFLRKLGPDPRVVTSKPLQLLVLAVTWSLLGFFVLGLAFATFHDHRITILTVLWFVFPWVVIFNTGIRYFCPPRYLIHYLGLYLPLAAVGIVVVWSWLERLIVSETAPTRGGRMRRSAFYVVTAAIAFAAVLAYGSNHAYYYRYPKQDWKAAVRFLEQNADLTEAVLAGGFWSDLALLYYGSEISKPLNLVIHVTMAYQIEYEMAIHRRVWYVTWGPMFPEVADLLARRFDPPQRFKGTQGDVFVYRSKADEGGNGGG